MFDLFSTSANTNWEPIPANERLLYHRTLLPSLPDEVITKTRAKYVQAFQELTGLELE